MNIPDETKVLFGKLLAGAAAARASDLHVRVGAQAFVRVDGRLSKVTGPTLTAELLEAFICHTSGRSTAALTGDHFEYSFEQPGAGRFRGHAFRENAHWAVALRVIPAQVPTFQELRLPPVVKTLSDATPGLVLITGPTGSGKSTTAAAMLRHAVSDTPLHVVTIEDPIEYRLSDPTACVSQREVGRDTVSLAEGLRAAMREDPDILFVGEIRDAESLETALQAAETGRAVFSTFHTSTAIKTVQRLIAMCPGDDAATTRSRLADTLRGVISQRLLPRKGTRGRILCSEIMINNYSMKECIRDASKIAASPAVIERSADQQMHSFDKHLASLVREGLVASDVAYSYATAPADLRRVLNLQGVEP